MKIKRTKIILEILSDVEDNVNDSTLENIIYQSDQGSWSMRTIEGETEILEGDEAIQACQQQGTDPEFFQLDVVDENDTTINDEPSEEVVLEYIAELITQGMKSGIDPNWSLSINTEEDNVELGDVDIEHIANMVKQGYVQGELCVAITEPEYREVRGWWEISIEK